MASLRGITAPAKLIAPSTVEFLTILALLRWARNQTGFIMAGLLGVAWGAHLTCYLDLLMGTNLIYDQYETVLGLVAVGQIAVCHDSFRHNFIALRDAVVRGRRARPIHASGGAVAFLHNEGDSSL